VSTLVPGRSVDAAGTALADGCVLAGGAGRRFGRPKADVRLGERTLVERAVAALVARCGRVVVVSRPGVPLPPLPVPVVLDRPGPDCPLVGLATGLAALAADDVLVLGCDLPLAGPLLDALAAAPPGVALAAARRGRPQPLCARYPRMRALAACERLLAAGALPALGLLDALGAGTVEDDGEALLNVNTPQDLARAMSILREPPLS
jgi:molybdopterin-guanine dinucleotide biosynthesis protein A